MRVLIVSDTHGRSENLVKVLDRVGKIDLLIHCGDVEGEEDYIEALAEVPCHIVSGNNDFFSSLPREEELTIAGKKFMITHGHYYGVSLGVDRLVEEARYRNVDVVCFGHTHRPLVRQEGSVTVINPGSLSYPRQERRKPSYIVMEAGAQGELEYEICFL